MNRICACCRLTQPPNVPFCSHCGEASWVTGIAPITVGSCPDLDAVMAEPTASEPPGTFDAPVKSKTQLKREAREAGAR